MELNKKPLGLSGLGKNKPDANVEEKVDNTDQTTTAAAAGVNQIVPGETANPRTDEDLANELDDEARANFAVNRGVVGAGESETVYSSHPVSRYKLGRFQFENSVLRLSDQDDIDEFEKLLDHPKLPVADRRIVKKIDVSKVDDIVKARMATKQFDSSVGRESLEKLKQAAPTVGIADIAHAKLAQMDNNIPQVPTPATDETGETGLDQGSHVADDSTK